MSKSRPPGPDAAVILRRGPIEGGGRPASPRRVRLVAALTALSGVVVLFSSTHIVTHGRLGSLARPFHPLPMRAGAPAATVAVAMGLLYLAGNLRRGKRSAWTVAVVLFALDLTARLDRVVVEGVHARGALVGLAVGAGMLGLLGASRQRFAIRSDPPTVFAVVRFVPVALTATFAYGLLTLHLLRHELSPEPSLGRDLLTVAEHLVGLDGEYTYGRPRVGAAFADSLGLLGLIGLAVTLVLLFRPIVARPHTDADRRRALDLVRRYGDDSLSWFALRPDKSYFFSSDGRAMVAYAYMGRCALVSGDPIGHPDAIDLVVDEFLAHCRAHGWGHAFLAVREDDVGRYLRRGLRSFYLGDEAVIDCPSFTLDGKRNKSMRQSVNRVARTHRFALLREVDAAPGLVAELNALSDRWRGRAPERGFTMALSQPVGPTNPDHLLCVALDEHDRPGGFLRIVPIVGDEPGYTLDMMRREPTAPNGMTEFLVANAAFALAGQGCARLSMNFAVMGALFSEDVPFTRPQRVLRRALALLNPFFQIKSLHEFNRRFRPRWVRRVVVYGDQRSLPQIALLYGAAEGFVSLPVLGRLAVPRRGPGLGAG